MPEYIARVHQPPRGVVELRVQADNEWAVPGALGLAPTQILAVHPLADPARPARAGLTPRRQRFALRQFCQELAVLLDAGITLLEALATLCEKEARGSASARVLDGVRSALADGRAFSSALADHPQAFDPLLVAGVAASERSGQLAQALREHGRYLAWSEGLRAQLVGAAIYPSLLLGVGLLVVLFLLLYVLPRFAGVLDGLAQEVPLASRLLIDLGVGLAAHPGALVAGLAAGLFAVLLALRSPRVRSAVQGGLWALPGLGPRLGTLALARCYRMLGMLLAAGVPLVPALDLVRGVAGARFAAALQALRADVSAGQRLSDALDRHGLATPVARRMVRVGERSGTLAAMLEGAAAFHDEELARLSELITRAVNPVLMLVMGTLIGGIVVLMYLPIFALVEGVQ
jgi:general secretion pathway protein F